MSPSDFNGIGFLLQKMFEGNDSATELIQPDPIYKL